MFTFTVSRQVKLDSGKDAWIFIDGTPVFPLGVGELLDERLNEAYITVVNSKTPVFRPCTEIMVMIKDGEAIKKQYYFTVARDDASEMPIGSGLYKHDLYLIERTKLLEGVVGQTVTFTNTGEASVKDAIEIQPTLSGDEASFLDFSIIGIKSPVLLYAPLTVKSAKEVGETVAAKANKDSNGGLTVKLLESYSDFETGTTISNATDTNYSYDASAEIVPCRGTVEIRYDLAFSWTAKGSNGTQGGTTQYKKVTATYTIAAIPNAYPMPRLTIADCINRSR